MKQNLLKYGLVMVLAMIASTGLLWAGEKAIVDSINHAKLGSAENKIDTQQEQVLCNKNEVDTNKCLYTPEYVEQQSNKGQIIEKISLFVLILAIIVLVWLSALYRRAPQINLYRSHHFIIHVVTPIITISILGMIILLLGGLECVYQIYSYIFNIFKTLREHFPILMSIVTTIMGLMVMFRCFYPRMRIHPLVAFEYNKGKTWLTFYVENADLFEAYDVKATLYTYHYQKRKGHDNKVCDTLELDNTSYVEKIGWIFGHATDNSVLVETMNDVFGFKSFMEKNDQLELSISVTHPVSRVKKIFVRYFTIDDIYPGEFIGGKLIKNKGTEEVSWYKDKERMWNYGRNLELFELLCLALIVITIIRYIICCNCPDESNVILQVLFPITTIVMGVIEMLRQICNRPIY